MPAPFNLTGAWVRVAFACVVAATVEACTRAPCGNPGTGFHPIFAAMATLLRDRQCIDLGSAMGADSPAGTLVHFQRFAAPATETVNSAEMHSNGCIYVAYTPPTGPVWYQTGNSVDSSANDSEDHQGDQIPAGAAGTQRFKDLQSSNINSANWQPPSRVFRNGHGPAPRWFSACFRDRDPASWTDQEKNQVPLGTGDDFMQNAGAYCEWQDTGLTGPEEWATVLPKNIPEHDFLQKKYFPNQPIDAVVNGTTNFYPTWLQLMNYAQHDPAKLRELLAVTDPKEDTYEDFTVPWVTSTLAGVVTNSFLSGKDYDGSHANPPGEQILGGQGFITPYWLGIFSPFGSQFGWFGNGGNQAKDVNSIKDDWVIFIAPDPEYRFYRARSSNPPGGDQWHDGRVEGNFSKGHLGNIENEIEQWLMPGGFRPDPGDRIFMAGRWVIDCGPGDWTSEIHPYELVASTHLDPRHGAAGGQEASTALTVTSNWTGDTLTIDLWPPARPSATARLHCARDPVTPSQQFPRGLGIGENVNVSQGLMPSDNPNHVRVMVISRTLPGALKTHGRNNVDPYFVGETNDTTAVSRRLAATYRLWWEEGGPSEACLLDAPPP